MKILLSLVVLFFLGCGAIRLDVAKMQGMKEDVKACMGVTQEIPPAVIQITENDYVICNNFKRNGCFQAPNTIILPRHTTENVIKHEWVHYILYITTGDLDAAHASPFFLKCSGLIVDE